MTRLVGAYIDLAKRPDECSQVAQRQQAAVKLLAMHQAFAKPFEPTVAASTTRRRAFFSGVRLGFLASCPLPLTWVMQPCSLMTFILRNQFILQCV